MKDEMNIVGVVGFIDSEGGELEEKRACLASLHPVSVFRNSVNKQKIPWVTL